MKLTNIVLSSIALLVIVVLGYRFVAASNFNPPEHWTLKVRNGQAGYITDQTGTVPWMAFYNGSVSIGGYSPDFYGKLNVQGGVVSEGTAGGSQFVLKSTATGGHQYEWYNDSPNIGDLGLWDRTMGRYSIVFKGNNSVGIGYQQPTQALDVAGYVKGTGLCIGTDCRTTWPSGGGGSTGTITSISAVPGGGIIATPNPITTTGTLAVDNSLVQRRVTGTCPTGQAMQGVNSNGSVYCVPVGFSTCLNYSSPTQSALYSTNNEDGSYLISFPVPVQCKDRTCDVFWYAPGGPAASGRIRQFTDSSLRVIASRSDPTDLNASTVVDTNGIPGYGHTPLLTWGWVTTKANQATKNLIYPDSVIEGGSANWTIVDSGNYYFCN